MVKLDSIRLQTMIKLLQNSQMLEKKDFEILDSFEVVHPDNKMPVGALKVFEKIIDKYSI